MDKYFKTTDAPQCGNHRLPSLQSQNELLAKRFCEEHERANANEKVARDLLEVLKRFTLNNEYVPLVLQEEVEKFVQILEPQIKGEIYQ